MKKRSYCRDRTLYSVRVYDNYEKTQSRWFWGYGTVMIHYQGDGLTVRLVPDEDYTYNTMIEDVDGDARKMLLFEDNYWTCQEGGNGQYKDTVYGYGSPEIVTWYGNEKPETVSVYLGYFVNLRGNYPMLSIWIQPYY